MVRSVVANNARRYTLCLTLKNLESAFPITASLCSSLGEPKGILHRYTRFFPFGVYCAGMDLILGPDPVLLACA